MLNTKVHITFITLATGAIVLLGYHQAKLQSELMSVKAQQFAVPTPTPSPVILSATPSATLTPRKAVYTTYTPLPVLTNAVK